MKKSNILYIFTIIALIIIMVFIYDKYYFNDYLKAIKEPNKTQFYRERDNTYNNQKSYCIDSEDYNTALFSKVINVKKNTPYRVTCYVKTENVENLSKDKFGGVNICITDTAEKSKSIVGTNDWTKLDFMFNSKNRENVEIGFRLGSYDTDAKGKVYFSNIKLEEGKLDEDNNWKMGCFIFENMDINIEGLNYISSMNEQDKELIEADLLKFKLLLSENSNNKINVEYDTYYIQNPLKTISFDENNGYYFDQIDVYNDIIDYVEKDNYDHIFIIFKSENINKLNTEALETDWVGLRWNGLLRNRLFQYKTSRK